MLQRDVHVGADFFVLGDRVEKFASDLVGIGVEKAHPAEIFNGGEFLEQQSEAVFEAEVFAVASGVLADEGNLADAAAGEAFGLGDHGFEAARTKLAAQLGNDAESAGMVAAFGNLDVRHVAGRGENARRGVVVKIVGKVADGSIP